MKQEDEDVSFENQVTFKKLPKIFIFNLNSTIPNVYNVTVFISHTSPTTVTNFSGGASGQTIRILGNGNTTISHNTTIKTNTGANKVLAANRMYSFTLMADGIWYEQ